MVKLKVIILLVMCPTFYCAPLPAPAPEERDRWSRQAHLWPQYSWKRSSPSARPTASTTTVSTSTTSTPATPPPGDRKGKKTPGLPVKQSPQVHHLGDGSHHDWWRAWIEAQAEAGLQLIRQQEAKEKAEKEAKKMAEERVKAEEEALKARGAELTQEEKTKDYYDTDPQPGTSGSQTGSQCRGRNCVRCPEPGPRCGAGKGEKSKILNTACKTSNGKENERT